MHLSVTEHRSAMFLPQVRDYKYFENKVTRETRICRRYSSLRQSDARAACSYPSKLSSGIAEHKSPSRVGANYVCPGWKRSRTEMRTSATDTLNYLDSARAHGREIERRVCLVCKDNGIPLGVRESRHASWKYRGTCDTFSRLSTKRTRLYVRRRAQIKMDVQKKVRTRRDRTRSVGSAGRRAGKRE